MDAALVVLTVEMRRPLERSNNSVFRPSVMIEKVEILEQSLRAVGVEAFGQFIAGSDIIDKYVASFRPQGALDHFG